MIRSDMKPIPVVCVVGYSNSGKTLLMEALIAALKALKYRVAAVKHATHGHQVGHPGKDSSRMLAAGADAVVMSSPDQATVIRRVASELSLDDVIASLGPDYDIVLIEGYKTSLAPKIVVLREGETAPNDADLSRPLATIVPEVGPNGALQLSPGSVRDLVELIVTAVVDVEPPMPQKALRE